MAKHDRYGRRSDVVHELMRYEADRFVVSGQNHDQVGNRALGDRLRGAELRLAAFCAILSRRKPLLFQGEEYDESRPFQCFTDHIDPLIADMTRKGRRREFSKFADFSAEQIPYPHQAVTFGRSMLDPSKGDPEQVRYYKALLALRRELPDEPTQVSVGEDRRLVRFRRSEAELMADFSEREQDGVRPCSGVVRR
jgi:maltooligosyltrehalose trehalohydrolase